MNCVAMNCFDRGAARGMLRRFNPDREIKLQEKHLAVLKEQKRRD